MAYKIIVDSSCDFTEEMKTWNNITVIPFTLQIGDYVIQDDENFDQEDFINRMSTSKEHAGSACPSPSAFAEACEGDEEDIYIVCIADKLSGCYNSAIQGANFYNEEHEDAKKNIHVFNSVAAAGIETLLALKINELAGKGLPFDEVVSEVEKYCVENCNLYFCLQSFDVFKNNGRLFNIATKVIEAVRVKLICGRSTEGHITIAGKDLTESRALNKLVSFIAKDIEGHDLTSEKVIINQVCCEEKANKLAQMIKDKCGYTDVVVLKAGGLNSLYASNGGIIVSYSK